VWYLKYSWLIAEGGVFMRLLRVILCLGLIFNLIGCKAKAEGKKMTIHEGSKVAFDYTLTVAGAVIDSSKERGPLEYVHGQKQIIPGLARQLEGLKAGDSKVITVAAKEAYGERKPEALKEFPKASLPQNMEPREGLALQMQTSQGQTFPGVITEVKEDAVVVDLNHPLAGKDLTFDVKIVSVE